MNLCEPFIRRPAGTSLLALGLALLGMVAYWALPVASMPRVDFPVVNVSAALPGADPETVASSLAAPLERRLSQIAGVTEITSVSSLGSTSISLQFEMDRSVNGAVRDVQAAINAAARDLPVNLPNPPMYRKSNPADTPILILALTSETLEGSKIFEAADQVVAQRLSQVEGVSQVIVNGSAKSAVRVQVHASKLASTGISMEEIRAFLAQTNASTPLGSLDGAVQSYTLECNDQLMHAGQYRNLIVRQIKGTPVQLAALGSAMDGVENTRMGAWVDGKPAVLLILFKEPGANVIETVDRIKTVLPQISRWISPAVKTTVVSDRTQTIRGSVADVQFSLLVSICLVVMVIFLFLRRLWPTFIACITVPLSVAGTFGAMYLFGYSIDNLSLMAITVSVGFVVDDAIVVIENIFRHVERGQSVMNAALQGAREIGFTVVSMSLSLVAVFIPLLFMSGLMGRLFHEFAVTLSMAILVSAVISLTLTPMLCSRLLKREADCPPQGAFLRAMEVGLHGLQRGYASALGWVLRHQRVMLGVTMLTFVATVQLYRTISTGLVPTQDTGMLRGSTEAAQDVSYETMARYQRRTARIVMDDPAVATVASMVGGGMGSSAVNSGSMFITLKPLAERKLSADEVIARIRTKCANLEGVSLFLQAAQDIRIGARSTKTQYQYSVQSPKLEELSYWSNRLLQKLQQIPQLKDVTSDQQKIGLQVNVVIDRKAAARLGVSPADIDNTLYDAFGQRQVATLYGRFNQYRVILEATPEEQADPSILKKLRVKSSKGAMVPLASVAKFNMGTTPLSINHQGQFPCVTLSFNLDPGFSLGDATRLVDEATEELRMPESVQGRFQGAAKVFKASMSNMPLLLFAALLTVYIVLGMLYENLVHPLTILSTLPSAGVGALLALMVVGYDLSLFSFIGIILLMGIVKKNAIMMVDFALEAGRTQGLPPEVAIYQACIVRFRPIMMTTMAALFGAIPLAVGMGIGSELRRPLGIAVVGGLLVSQVLTLFTTPVVYLALERLRLRCTGGGRA